MRHVSFVQKLLKLAERAGLREKIDSMFNGDHINTTEDRAVLHTALRSPRKATIMVEGQNVVKDVWEVLDRISDFSEKVRSGEWTGITGKMLKTLCVSASEAPTWAPCSFTLLSLPTRQQ